MRETKLTLQLLCDFTLRSTLMPRLCCLLVLSLCCSYSAVGKPVTEARIVLLPSADEPAWSTYLERSEANAQADQDALEAELKELSHSKARIVDAVAAPSGGDFKLSAKLGDQWFAGKEAERLATIVLSYQTPSGGWSKHTSYSKGPRQPGMLWSSQYEPGESPHYLGTFDNRSTTEQLLLLAGVWQATQREDCQQGFTKGLRYILAAQYPTGGWPQVYPLEGDYHDSITLNDDALAHILELLYAIESQQPAFALVDDHLRSDASASLARALRCVAAMQITHNGQKTGWCAQHDAMTLQPVSARAMEPASISGVESARLVKVLMTIENPSAELEQVIESALVWLDKVKVTGLAKTKVDGQTAYIADPNATDALWARFYSLETSAPIFPGRDGVLYDSFAEMAAKNDLGYDFYSTIPGSIVKNGQKKWRKMLAKHE